MSRKENQILTELELEARDRTQRLLERANTLRMEQEDEVKKLNQVKMCVDVDLSIMAEVLKVL